MLKTPPKSILFICHLNAVRSPMAQGLMQKMFPDIERVASCGLQCGEQDDYMITVMREKGVDMNAHETRSLSQIENVNFERVVAFTDDAFQAAQAVFGERKTVIDLWSIPVPGAGSLDVRALLNNYRAIRDNIETRLRQNFS